MDPAPRLVIDTNIAIYLTRSSGYGLRARRAVESYAIAVSFYTGAELLFTARKSADPDGTRAYWLERLADGRIAVLWPDLDTCSIWAELNGFARDSGKTPSPSDAWVASTALRYELPLLTNNPKDFAWFPGLDLRPLPD